MRAHSIWTHTLAHAHTAELSSRVAQISIAQEQQWTAQLGRFLTGDLQLRRPHQLRRASETTNAAELGEAMPLVAREEALDRLYELSFGQFQDWNNRVLGSPNLRKSIMVPTCCGASGIGKTRFSSQAFYLIHERIQTAQKSPRDPDEARFRSALSRCVKTELVLEIDILDAPDTDEYANPACSITFRTLYHYCQRYKYVPALNCEHDRMKRMQGSLIILSSSKVI
jgi:hypothetical protein